MELHDGLSLALQSAQLRQQWETNNRLANLQTTQAQQAERAAQLKNWKDAVFTVHEQIPLMEREAESGHAALACWQAMSNLSHFRGSGITSAFFDDYEDKRFFSATESDLKTVANLAAERLGPEMAASLARLLTAYQSISLYRQIIAWYQARAVLERAGVTNSGKGWSWSWKKVIGFFVGVGVLPSFGFPEDFLIFLLTVGSVVFVIFLLIRYKVRKERRLSALREAVVFLRPFAISLSEESTVEGFDYEINQLNALLESMGVDVAKHLEDAQRLLAEELAFINAESERQQLVLSPA